MDGLLFFILGLIIGGLFATTLMCCLQINRIIEYEKMLNLREEEINKLELNMEANNYEK